MKKLLLVLPLIGFNAYAEEEPVVTEQPAVVEEQPAAQELAFVSGCEKFLASEMGGDVYKCAMSDELSSIQDMGANAMFGSLDGLDTSLIAGDTENVYVNVYGTCETEGQVQYRVMVKNPVFDGSTMYAVEVCR